MVRPVGVLVEHQHVAPVENHRNGDADVPPQLHDLRVVVDGCSNVIGLANVRWTSRLMVTLGR